MKQDELERLAESFFKSVGTAMRGMGAVFRKELEGYDVTWPQFHLLKQVESRDGLQVTEVSSLLMIAPPTASRMIDGLAAKGLLRKEKDERDHRVTRVLLTGDGGHLMEEMRKALRRLMIQVLEGEDEEEVTRALDYLERIADQWYTISEQTTKSRGEDG